MDDMEYDHLVADALQIRLPNSIWRGYPAKSVDEQAKRFFMEHLGIQIELDVQTTVIRVQEDVVVRIE
jgi:hypothetical protein